MKTEILKLLKEQNGYISGQDLCEHFGVSRTAVWKSMNQLKKEGYEIEAVSNKGYRLLSVQADVLGKSELESRIATMWCGRTIHYYEQTDSTNIQAKLLGEQGAAHGTLVVANMQTEGRGRRGRSWISPAGTNVYFTLLLRPAFEPGKASMLTLVMALSVAKAIQMECGIEPGIKWPNDVVINGKKAVGILTEMNAEPDYINYVVVGVGINTGRQLFPEELSDKVTSLYAETGRTEIRAAMIQRCMECFEIEYDRFKQAGNLSVLREEYHAFLVNKDRRVRVLDPLGEYNGIAEGINENGELLVTMEDGSMREVYAGEVSVRGIYGYV